MSEPVQRQNRKYASGHCQREFSEGGEKQNSLPLRTALHCGGTVLVRIEFARTHVGHTKSYTVL